MPEIKVKVNNFISQLKQGSYGNPIPKLSSLKCSLALKVIEVVLSWKLFLAWHATLQNGAKSLTKVENTDFTKKIEDGT